ncbi:MAG TPA: DUF2851 family protein, partial [Prolixibacteraceae bacterium]|nr:DUF2851 family protein [Prolixibacteraceae bacterium]
MSTPKNMPEEFLQFVWENNLFENHNLRTEKGISLEIINTGRRNTNSGPDFFNARILLGGTEWAGNIEVHKKSSDWLLHNHQNDKAYNNVILHVVGQHDKEICRSNKEPVATLVLKYPAHCLKNYNKLLAAKTWIACENDFHKINPVMLRLGFNRLMIERLEQKTTAIRDKLLKNGNNWNETFYQVLAAGFGFKVNALPFELLANAIPLNILAKHKNNLFQLEALLFGASGLLNEELIGDDYYLKLREEFSFLYRKYKIKPVEGHLWKFMRLRPGNFPTIRIAQLAALVYHSHGMFSKITEAETVEALQQLFKTRASGYWDNHYRFNKQSKKIQPRVMGESSINILLINVVIPFLFIYGEMQEQHHLKDRALNFLEQLPAENNY